MVSSPKMIGLRIQARMRIEGDRGTAEGNDAGGEDGGGGIGIR